jgi:hypothetical protein
MRAIEQRIAAVLAEKGAAEQKLARMEASYKAEIEALKAVSAAPWRVVHCSTVVA